MSSFGCVRTAHFRRLTVVLKGTPYEFLARARDAESKSEPKSASKAVSERKLTAESMDEVGLDAAKPKKTRAAESTTTDSEEQTPEREEVVQRCKGFGFITRNGGREDFFAHFSEVKAEGFKSLQENQKVSFEVKQGLRGNR